MVKLGESDGNRSKKISNNNVITLMQTDYMNIIFLIYLIMNYNYIIGQLVFPKQLQDGYSYKS